MMIKCLVAILHKILLREGERKRERGGRGTNTSCLWLMRERKIKKER